MEFFYEQNMGLPPPLIPFPCLSPIEHQFVLPNSYNFDPRHKKEGVEAEWKIEILKLTNTCSKYMLFDKEIPPKMFDGMICTKSEKMKML